MSEIIEMNADNATATDNGTETGYTLRALCSKDVFPMSKIISKIGINEFTKAFEGDDIKNLVETLTSEGGDMDNAATMVGVTVALDIANTILGNLSAAEQDIYRLLSGLSGMTQKEIEALPLNTFLNMIIDVIRKDEFKGFFKVVSRLFKSEN